MWRRVKMRSTWMNKASQAVPWGDRYSLLVKICRVSDGGAHELSSRALILRGIKDLRRKISKERTCRTTKVMSYLKSSTVFEIQNRKTEWEGGRLGERCGEVTGASEGQEEVHSERGEEAREGYSEQEDLINKENERPSPTTLLQEYEVQHENGRQQALQSINSHKSHHKEWRQVQTPLRALPSGASSLQKSKT